MVHPAPEQQKQILKDLHADRERLKRQAIALCGKMPQEQVSLELGVPQQTISGWLNGEDTSFTDFGKTSKPD